MISDMFRHPEDTHSHWVFNPYSGKWGTTVVAPDQQVMVWYVWKTKGYDGKAYWVVRCNELKHNYRLLHAHFKSASDATTAVVRLSGVQMTAFWLLPNDGEDPT